VNLLRSSAPAALGVETVALTDCDREPIHRPDAIQPYGLLLIADARTLRVVAGAGDIEGRLCETWQGMPLDTLLGIPAERLRPTDAPFGRTSMISDIPYVEGIAEQFNIMSRVQGENILVELEPPAPLGVSPLSILTEIDRLAEQFELSPDVTALCGQAAEAFRRLTGFDRVMIYRFLEDGSGEVLAEDRSDQLGSLLNHRFPATDIPVQARALYVRNRIRTIPDVSYIPAPIRPANAGVDGIDLSDISLRSVSPVHMQYMRNMGVAASASVSIVLDGMLWGLVACHHATPRLLGNEARAACNTLAGVMSRQLRAKEELATYQERLRLRNAMDMLQARTDPDLSVRDLIRTLTPDLRAMFPSHGFAVLQGDGIRRDGICPSAEALAALGRWVEQRNDAGVFSSANLASVYPEARAFRESGSGVLAVSLPLPTPILLLWLRAEVVETIEWAGNPHAKTDAPSGAPLQPRTSFETWSETVRGQSARWNNEQLQTARRLRRSLMETHHTVQLRELNQTLNVTLTEREKLLRQKDFLIREVNHRVQNSLQLVASFLKLQSRSTKNDETNTSLAEAQRRIAAIGLVHRRLYRDETFGVIDLSRYLEELCLELCSSIGEDWTRQLTLSLTPALISADRAINIGLVVTELVINASKYAYDGAPGPLSIALTLHDDRLAVSVSDRGQHDADPQSSGFGLRMMNAVVSSLSGVLKYDRLNPGLRAVVSLPIEALPNGMETGLPH
jgi:two-component system, chemotaxis family, sensor kinase Cph1